MLYLQINAFARFCSEQHKRRLPFASCGRKCISRNPHIEPKIVANSFCVSQAHQQKLDVLLSYYRYLSPFLPVKHIFGSADLESIFVHPDYTPAELLVVDRMAGLRKNAGTFDKLF